MTVAHIRWMIRRDMLDVLNIENLCFDYPWSEEEFISCLRQRNVIGMVAEIDDQVAGYMIYEPHRDHLRLLRIAVHAKWQGKGVGAALMKKLSGKLSAERRKKVTLDVRETNLQAQMFFKSLGFVATDVLRGFCPDTGEDAYYMVLHHGWLREAAL